MGKQENLDDFLRQNLNDDSSFEYNNADWAKAEKLIANNNKAKIAQFSFKKVISVLAVLIAMIVLLVNINSETHNKVATNKIKKSAIKETDSEKALVNKGSKTQTQDLASNIDETTQISSNETNQLKVENFSKTNQAVTKSTNNINVKENIKETASKENSKPLKSLSKTDDVFVNNRLNEYQDYAENDTKKHWYNFGLINIFNRNKSNNNNALNIRNLNAIKKIAVDTTINYADFKSNSNNPNNIKVPKPITVDLIFGCGIYKQFTGNLPHTNTPAFDPFTGVSINFSINKKLSINNQILYAQRGGLNSSYLSLSQSGDSDIVTLKKIYSIELPVSITYLLNKNNYCYGGLSPIFYIANSSIQQSSSGDKKVSAKGLVYLDVAFMFGYKYNLSNKLYLSANAFIGIRDVTKNKIYIPASREDNVGFRIGIGYKIFSKHEL